MELVLLINKINKYTRDILVTSLLFLIINTMRSEYKHDICINFSNIFLIASILMIICVKTFILNIDTLKLQNYIDIDDTLMWAISLICIKVFFGITFSVFHLISITFRFGYIPIYLIVLMFTLDVIRNLVITNKQIQYNLNSDLERVIVNYEDINNYKIKKD